MSDPREIRWGGVVFDTFPRHPYDGQQHQVTTTFGPAELVYCNCCKTWRSATGADQRKLYAHVQGLNQP